ncbi:MAG TPA: PDZ domain-containing protein [Vicinamibacterales bacterium]|nr:PDZ domain-containing protein [Vicinamibacterales bacterium]
MRIGPMLFFAAAVMVPAAQQTTKPPVLYKISFPSPEHHVAQIEVTWNDVPRGTLEARMSRSSPGRYALHEFAKNVYDVHAFNGAGTELKVVRPNPYEWDVAGHDGTVRMAYSIYGDHVDGTYLAIDLQHAHLNMPATFMWARGMDDRSARITFTAPAGLHWKVATQLFTTTDPWTYTAPNLQYLFDSPTELSDYTLKSFEVRNPDGNTFTIRAAVHAKASADQVQQYVDGLQKIVNEASAVYGEFPQYEPGTYTFLADYLPTNDGDGMEHRNSTVVTGRVLRTALNTASHEFFHCWNVERIRPQGLEPFNFEEANMTDSLWLAEGFTQYYGPLIMTRAGLTDQAQAIAGFGRNANAVVNGSGRRFRSAVDMSRMAPFVDAARAVDRTNFNATFISYYTYGATIAVGLDLTLRERSGGKVTLDDFMRAMWRTYGKPGGPEPGLVGHPYSLDDVRDRLADVSGDRAFADVFMKRYIVGREAIDYARVARFVGVLVQKAHEGAAWMGDLVLRDESDVSAFAGGTRLQGGGTVIAGLVDPGSPAYDAGLEQDDTITSLDGTDVSTPQQIQQILRAHKPGDRIAVGFTRRTGPATATLTLAEDPAIEFVIDPNATPAQVKMRDAWLSSRKSR